MYYWKTNKLVEEIKADTLTERSKKNYYIGSSVITLAGMYLLVIAGTNNIALTLLEGLLILIVLILGVNWTFRTNNGKDYIARVVILSFPLLIKIYAASLSVGVICGIYAAMNNSHSTNPSPWLTILINVGIQVIFFWRLNVHLSRIKT